MTSLSSETPSDPLPANKPSASDLPQDTLNFAAKMFDLARNGEDELLGAYLDAGLPPNLTNYQGSQSLVLMRSS